MSISTWQSLVLFFLILAIVCLYNIGKSLEQIREALWSVYGKTGSLLNEVRLLRWMIYGGPIDHDDDENTPFFKPPDTIAEDIRKIRNDLLSIRSEIAGDTEADED